MTSDSGCPVQGHNRKVRETREKRVRVKLRYLASSQGVLLVGSCPGPTRARALRKRILYSIWFLFRCNGSNAAASTEKHKKTTRRNHFPSSLFLWDDTENLASSFGFPNVYTYIHSKSARLAHSLWLSIISLPLAGTVTTPPCCCDSTLQCNPVWMMGKSVKGS